MPVTDAKQRVTPALPKHEEWLDHAEISFITDIKHRNKRLVVHHYASRSFEDYQTKLARGAGDHTRGSHLRGMGFFNALNECVPSPALSCFPTSNPRPNEKPALAPGESCCWCPGDSVYQQ